MVFHGDTAARDHTPRVQPRHTHHRRATPGRHSPATSNTYYLPRYVPRRVLPRARNKPALFLRVIENFRQTRTANLAWYAATLGRYIASSLRLRSAHRSKCSASLHVSSGFDMKIRLSLAGEKVPGEHASVPFLLCSVWEFQRVCCFGLWHCLSEDGSSCSFPTKALVLSEIFACFSLLLFR